MDRALTGMKVLDMTHALAGPYCAQMLADMGADVIKIENPNLTPETRGGPPYVNGESVGFMMVNRNKRSLTLNLKDPRGKDILFQLAKESDVFVQNFRPGAVDRMGIGYETMRDVNPSIVYCSISGFGHEGPYSKLAGLDLIAEGLSGLMAVTGEPGRIPLKVISICDFGTGMFACHGVLTAYIHRLFTGEGQHVDACLLDTAFPFLRKQVLHYFVTGEVPQPTGWWDVGGAPYQAFQVKGGRWINVAGQSSFLWPKFCQALGAPQLSDDPRFDTGQKRHDHREELANELQQIFLTRSEEEWLANLQKVGVPCGPIRTVDQVVNDPHTAMHEMVVERPHPIAGTFKMLGIPVKLSETPGEIQTAPPTLGQHTDEILHSLGYTDSQIAALRQDGVV